MFTESSQLFTESLISGAIGRFWLGFRRTSTTTSKKKKKKKKKSGGDGQKGQTAAFSEEAFLVFLRDFRVLGFLVLGFMISGKGLSSFF
jgi:hypothetical protein